VKAVPGRGHLLELDREFDEIWTERFASKARTAVRKAEKSGVTVEHDTTGSLIPEFLHLRRLSVERWARQQHEPLTLARWRAQRREPDERLQTMAAAPSGFHLYLARHEGQPVAGIVVLYGRGASYVLGAMDKALAGPVRANDLLQRVAIEDACRAGCSFYDFGETGTNAELGAFKMRFGARPTSWSDYVIERLPLTEAGRSVRTVVKRVVGFQGPPPVAAQPDRAAGSPG
jgi:lipid II:glycine glycyltransferase (peptidoglycan interpeptide bridge formation enzyme)